MLDVMDSDISALTAHSLQPYVLPGWMMSRGTDTSEADAAFMAGNALNSLDNLVRTEPSWGKSWRGRLALRCAVAGVRLMGRAEDELALRDAVLLRGYGDDAGPAGNVYLANRRLTDHKAITDFKAVGEVADLFSVRWGDEFSGLSDLIDNLLRSGRTVPFLISELVTRICTLRPDAEILAWWLADWTLAQKLGWSQAVPLLIAQRYGTAFRIAGGRGRVQPGDDGFARAVCFALVDASSEALRLAGDMERRAAQLLLVAPKVRTKGADKIILQLLNDDALSATAPGLNLSRWASRRLFERLEDLGGIRELSGRTTFRIYGL
jgi:hypothetical protein